MAAKKRPVDKHSQLLFPDLPEPPAVETIELRNLRHPVWTENKAQLIARYLKLFTYVTKHGTYIDGFAGRQSDATDGGWAAEMVLGISPRRMRQFYLCEKSREGVQGLQQLAERQPPKGPRDSKREVKVFPGDFNKSVYELLATEKLERATFCLLDQRTFECHWSTVEALAKHRTSGRKIELFYFLPIGWLNRAILSTKTSHARIDSWWGGTDWKHLVDMQHLEKAMAFKNRFEQLGYKHVLPLPIYDRKGGGRVMFYMILASDHEAAPRLMWRSYDQSVNDIEGWDQLGLKGF